MSSYPQSPSPSDAVFVAINACDGSLPKVSHPQYSAVAADRFCGDASAAYSASVVSPYLAALFLVVALLLAQRIKLGRDRSRSPIEGLVVVPGAHWLFGHLSYVFASLPPLPTPPDRNAAITDADAGHTYQGGWSSGDVTHTFGHPHLFCKNANPSGISVFWVFDKACASVLKASHVRDILRQTSTRNFSNIIVRHGRRTLGEESLILIEGGAHWKKQRSIIAKAFTVGALSGSRGVILDAAEDMTGLLLKACAGSDDGTVCVDMSVFFKSLTLDIFGRMALGHDFRCMPEAAQSIRLAQQEEAGKAGSGGGGITRISMPEEAEAFDYLVQDISVRGEPKALINPAMQFYWMPTRRNKEYADKLGIIKVVLHDIINRHKDAVKSEMEDDLDAFNGRKRYRNMLTHLIVASNNEAGAEELSSIITTLLFAGYETSAISLSLVIYCLAIHPDVQAKCAEEARRVFRNKRSRWGSRGQTRSSDEIDTDGGGEKSGDGGEEKLKDEESKSSASPLYYGRSDGDDSPDKEGEELLSEDDLPYCKAALIESLRMHSTVIFTTRRLTKPISLDGVNLPEGMRMYIPVGNVHLDERNFARALEYLPERWVRWEEGNGGDDGRWVDRDHVKEAKERASSGGKGGGTSSIPDDDDDYIPAADHHNFFAFSGGARNCVGRRLAVYESIVTIATLIRDLVVAVDPDFVLEKKRRFVTSPPKSMPITFRKREW